MPARGHDLHDFSCQDLVELVTEYLENTLSPALRTTFELHIADCPTCQEYLDQMRRTITITGVTATEGLSAEAVDSMMEAFRHWKNGRPAG